MEGNQRWQIVGGSSLVVKGSFAVPHDSLREGADGLANHKRSKRKARLAKRLAYLGVGIAGVHDVTKHRLHPQQTLRDVEFLVGGHFGSRDASDLSIAIA